jgi:hypothetical protein
MQSGYIYKICCNLTGETYYGSTESDIEERIANHVRSANTEEGRKCMSKQIIDRDDWCYEIMEEVDFIVKRDLLVRERFYFDNYECINIQKPYNTDEEIKEMDAKKKKKYRSNPDNARREREHKRAKTACPCGGSYSNDSRSEHFKTELHKYYVENGTPRPTKGESIKCPCGGKYQMKNKKIHDEGQRHKRYIDNN